MPPGALLTKLNRRPPRRRTPVAVRFTVFCARADVFDRTRWPSSNGGHNPPHHVAGGAIGASTPADLGGPGYLESSSRMRSARDAATRARGYARAPSPTALPKPRPRRTNVAWRRSTGGGDARGTASGHARRPQWRDCRRRLQFVGNAPQSDDQTLLVLRHRGAPDRPAVSPKTTRSLTRGNRSLRKSRASRKRLEVARGDARADGRGSVQALTLALDEVVTNIISCTPTTANEHRIEIRVDLDGTIAAVRRASRTRRPRLQSA